MVHPTLFLIPWRSLPYDFFKGSLGHPLAGDYDAAEPVPAVVADVLKTYVVPWLLSSDLPGPSCVVPFTGLSPKLKISVPWNQMTTNLIPIKIKPKCVMMYIIGIIVFLGYKTGKLMTIKH